MQTKPTIEPAGSPVPGVIPEPLRVHQDTVAGQERPTSTARGTGVPASSPGRRSPVPILLAKLRSALGSPWR